MYFGDSVRKAISQWRWSGLTTVGELSATNDHDELEKGRGVTKVIPPKIADAYFSNNVLAILLPGRFVLTLRYAQPLGIGVFMLSPTQPKAYGQSPYAVVQTAR